MIDFLSCYSIFIESISSLLTCIATIAGVFIAIKNIEKMQIENRFQSRLQNYLKIVKPYYEVFKVVDILKRKCEAYQSDDKSILNSINHIIKNQLQNSVEKVNEYYSTYISITLDAKIAELLEHILSKCLDIDNYAVDDDIVELLKISEIQQLCENILQLQKELSLECAKLFNIDEKTFEENFKKDRYY